MLGKMIVNAENAHKESYCKDESQSGCNTSKYLGYRSRVLCVPLSFDDCGGVGTPSEKWALRQPQSQPQDCSTFRTTPGQLHAREGGQRQT